MGGMETFDKELGYGESTGTGWGKKMGKGTEIGDWDKEPGRGGVGD